MIAEALSWYVESLSAFWVSLAGGGLFKLILILCLIRWICCRRRRCGWHHHGCGCHAAHRGCPHCGCPHGHSHSEAGESGDDEDKEAAEAEA